MIIENLVKEPEGNRLEFHSKLPDRAELSKTICAFSNCSGGYIIIGVDPATREIMGLERDEIFDIQDNLKKFIWDFVEPLPVIKSQVLIVENKKLFSLNVISGGQKPYCVKGEDKISGVFERSGRDNIIAGPGSIAKYDALSLNIFYDSLPVYDATVDDLDSDLIGEYLERRKKFYPTPRVLINYAFLEKNKLIKRERGKMYPTVASILCFSERINDYFPGAKVKCSIYEDDENSDMLAQKEFQGPLINLIKPILLFFRTTDIPEQVLKELIANAIIHRDYSFKDECIEILMLSECIKIKTPGGLDADISISELGQGVCVYRNKEIYRFFSDMGFGNNLYSGLQGVNVFLKDANYKEIEHFYENNNLVTVVYSEPEDEYLTKEEEKVLDYIKENEYISNAQCQKILRVKGKQAQYILMKLVSRDKLVSVGEKKGRKYLLPE